MIKLSEIVAQFLDEQNLGQSEYARAYRFANRAVKELNWDVTGEVKVVEVVADEDKTILLPTDLLKVLDFGISSGKGKIASYDKVNVIDFDNDVAKNEDDFDFLYGNNPDTWWNQPYATNNGFSAEYPLGIGSYNSIGEYQVSDDNRRIIISPKAKYTKFLLQYLSNSTCEDEVNELLAPSIVAYIKWKFFQIVNKYSSRDIDYFKNEFYREKKNAKNRIKGLTVQQMNKSARESVKMGLKS